MDNNQQDGSTALTEYNANTDNPQQDADQMQLQDGQPEEQLPFSSTSQTTSFSDLAKQNECTFGNLALPNVGPNQSLSQNILSHTLSDYGAIAYNQPTGPVYQQGYMQPQLPATNQDLPMGPVTITNPEPFNQPIFIPPSSMSNAQVSYAMPQDNLLYSPPERGQSPPMDQIREPDLNPNTGRPVEVHSKIPKLSDKAKTDDFDDWNMIDLQEKYRNYEHRVKENNSIKSSIENQLHTMTRNSKGRNIEQDAQFRRKQDEKNRCIDEHKYLRDQMKKVSDKLYIKFGFKIQESNEKSGYMPNSNPKRAHMSTTQYDHSRSHQSKTKSPSYLNRVSFKLSDSRTWCRKCDEHFDNLKDYCDHLHHRSHRDSMEKVTPWRENKEDIDIRKTHDMLKSICSRLSNELERDFTVTDLDAALNPSIADNVSLLKERNHKRERAVFDSEEPLFVIRGYEHVIPTLGYYCALCSKALCDFTSMEQHLKSFDHNYAHAKSVAVNKQDEVSFRNQMEKSYRRLHPDASRPKRPEVPASASKIPMRQVAAKSTTGVSVQAALKAYKKATSQIVDEHEVIANKFPDRSKPNDKDKNAANSDDDVNDEPTVKETQPSRVPFPNEPYEPELVPAGKSRPGALQRLRNTDTSHIFGKNNNKRKTNKVLDDDEVSDDDVRTAGDVPKSPKVSTPKKKAKDIEEEVSDVERTRGTKRSRVASSETPSPRRRSKPKRVVESDSEKDDGVSSGDETNKRYDTAFLPKGDPDSPYPELTLFVTGNCHKNELKNKRLRQVCRPVLNRINLDDYKDWLMDPTSTWSRFNQLVAKREYNSDDEDDADVGAKSSRRNDVGHVTFRTTEPTFFGSDGELMPIDLVDDADENRTSDLNLSSSNLAGSKPYPRYDSNGLEMFDGSSSSKEKAAGGGAGLEAPDGSNTDSDPRYDDDSKDKWHMSMLEEFFVEK